MTKQNYIRVATQVGDLLKHNSLVFISDINMKGEQILLGARKDNLDPKTNIEPERKARLIYNWIMSLYETAIDPDSDPDIKNGMLVDFCMAITPQYSREELKKILINSDFNLSSYGDNKLKSLTSKTAIQDANEQIETNIFESHNFHNEIRRIIKNYYLKEYYTEAVFEAAKTYNRLVKEKSQMELDGTDLMFKAWDPKKGTLKVNKCETETEMNVQNGLGHLSAGLMSAIRNPNAHEPAHLWQINKEDCLDILAFTSFLLKQLDKATYFKQ